MVAVALVHGEMAERDGGQQMAIEHNNKASDAWTDAGPVEAQIRELEHQIEHLVRSNVEMKEFLEQAPDAELRTAIGENIVTIARRRAIIEDLRKMLPPDLTGTGSIRADLPVTVSVARTDEGEGLYL